MGVGSTDVREPRLRADARRNRERIIAAARELFVVWGAEAPLDEIARHAGVGNATLYRHFADRADLIHQVALSVMARIHDRAVAARTEHDDAFQALRRFVHAAADERIGALCPLLSGVVDRRHPDLVAARDLLHSDVADLMRAAAASGQLRTDVEHGDLVVAVAQLTRPLPDSGCADFHAFTHRHLELFLDGLMNPARSALPGTAVTVEGLRRRS